MQIRPFRGWRFRGEQADVSRNIAPPYDILSQADKDELLAGGETNIVAVDLPHVPPKEAGPDECYRQAADTLNQWKASGVLVQDEAPCLYAYEQTYTWAGKTHSRRALLCGVRATPLGQDVIPHEHTFAGPKADRLKLTEHTRTQLSPIFGFYSDPSGNVADALWSSPGAPALHGQLGPVEEKLWVVSDPAVIADITATLADAPAFIADGHHRYTTAMNYADALRASGQIDENHEANFVLFSLVAQDDPGLLVLPTHRIVRGLAEGFSVAKLRKAAVEFDWQRCSVTDADLSDADAFLHRYGPGAMAFMDADPAEIWIARLTDPGAMAEVAPEELPEWHKLDVAILHKLIIDRHLDPWRTDELAIDYTPDGRAVLAACNSGRAKLGALLQGTPLTAVEAIAKAGASMPHKSTYFYPKLATGMVLKPLE